MKTQTIQTISKFDVAFLISSVIAKGQLFSVVFTKKPKMGQKVGDVRTMVCRKGVTSGLNPSPSRPRASMPSNLVTVFEMVGANKTEDNKGGYKQFNLETLKKIKAGGVTFLVA